MREFFECECDTSRSVTAAETQERLSAVLEILRPKPSPFGLVRVGGVTDGAYLVPDDLANVKACFSPGVANRKDFEDQLTNQHGIPCHMCDYSSDEHQFRTPLVAGKQTFEKAWLEPDGKPNSIDLKSWISQYYADDETDLMLQMDIEGAEYRNLLQLDDETLQRFRVMILEVHGLKELNTDRILNSVLFECFSKIGKAFTCIHTHPNNYSEAVVIPTRDIVLADVLELTFIRSDLIQQGAAHDVLIPHPLDITNWLAAEPIVLSEYWCGGSRPIASKIKILEDELLYQKISRQRMADVTSKQIAGAFRAAIGGRTLASTSLSDHEREARDALRSLDEVSVGHVFALTSGFPATGVVPAAGGDYFFHTGLGFDQAITVDLGRTVTIEALVLVNRVDACFDRASLLGVSFSQTGRFDEGSDEHLVEMPAPFTDGTKRHALVTIPSVEARFVRLSSKAWSWFHLAGLRVYGADARA